MGVDSILIFIKMIYSSDLVFKGKIAKNPNDIDFAKILAGLFLMGCSIGDASYEDE